MVMQDDLAGSRKLQHRLVEALFVPIEQRTQTPYGQERPRGLLAAELLERSERARTVRGG